MTMHTRAATDEIYDIFNQPLMAETEEASDSLCGSDYEDDDCTSVGESTVTGRVSAASSDFGDDETTAYQGSVVGDSEEPGYDDTTRADSVDGSEWTEFTNKDIPEVSSAHTGEVADSSTFDNVATPGEGSVNDRPERQRFIPEMPEDYNPPCGPYRDPVIAAQNRLPFMTPIVEQTEHSLASMTAAKNSVYNSKTPSKPMQVESHVNPGVPPDEDLLLSSPVAGGTPDPDENFTEFISQSPTAKKTFSPRLTRQPRNGQRRNALIQDKLCNPVDQGIRNKIIKALDPPLASYHGYHDHSTEPGVRASEIQKVVKAMGKRPKSGDSFDPPILEFRGAERSYVLRRELGAGAYAPVYLAESIESPGSCPSLSDSETDVETQGSRDSQPTSCRFGFEAVKMEIGPPNAWEFYMIRTAHERLTHCGELSRAADSIVRAHELHVLRKESFLVEDYRGQGTLLDLVNLLRNGNTEGSVEEALAMFFAVELFRTVEALHSCNIIHGDIKPDNCLIRFDDPSTAPMTPSLVDVDEDENLLDGSETHYSPRGAFGWRNKGLALIDFGRAIDMHAFEPTVQFIADWQTKDHECNEIREMRPWRHQIDLYGMAGTIHVMLFGKYMETVPVRTSGGGGSDATNRTYRIRESLKRYWDRELWSDVFDLLLNPCSERWAQVECQGTSTSTPKANVLPVVNSMRYIRERMEMWLMANAEKKNLPLQIRKLEAVFAERKRKLERQ